jgi:hypothetical protein
LVSFVPIADIRALSYSRPIASRKTAIWAGDFKCESASQRPRQRREHEEFRNAYDLAREQRAEARSDRIDFSRSQYRYLTLWLRTTTPGQRCRMK